MTLQEIYDRVSRALRDVAITQIDTTDVIRWGNDGQLRIAREIECLQGVQETNVVAGTDNYTLPTDFLRYKRVTLDGKELEFTTLEQLSLYNSSRDVSNSRSVPDRYYRWNQRTYLFPIPASSGTSNLDVWYIKQPTIMTLISNTPSIPVQYHETLLLYCKAKAYEQIKDYELSSYTMQQFLSELAEAQNEESTPNEATYPSVRSVLGDDW